MFGGNDQPPTPPSAPIQTSSVSETAQIDPRTQSTQKIAGAIEAAKAKPGELTPSTDTDKSLLGG